MYNPIYNQLQLINGHTCMNECPIRFRDLPATIVGGNPSSSSLVLKTPLFVEFCDTHVTCLFATWSNLFRSCSTLKTSNIPMFSGKKTRRHRSKDVPSRHSPWDRPESRCPAVQGCQSARWRRPWRTSVAPGQFDLWWPDDEREVV